MLNKKFILTFICLLISLFIYAESGTLTSGKSKIPHHEFTIKNDEKQNRYRIQMSVPHYAYYVDAESCSYNECFPNFGMGISREEGCFNHTLPNYSALWIFPDIIIKDENLKDVFSIKGESRDLAGYLCKCYASDWKIYEKGLVLDVLLVDDTWNTYGAKKLKRVYLELKEDGKYYEIENSEKLGKLRKSFSANDFLDEITCDDYCSSFNFYGYSIYKMGSGKNIESVLISNIFAYNTTEEGIEFITPYGCGFFDFTTESICLVSKDKYLRREFTYTPYVKGWGRKIKENRKIITEADLNPPDIKIPLSEYDLSFYAQKKQKNIQRQEQDQLIKAELLAQ